ncbi:DNA helicase (plasmid) [Mycobacterium intracellulare subsp. chimaera]|nr:DNA helicase [Mycobacterium intracellulare subsp. chimaera]PBA69020.1 ATP-dependent helicase [Mycobacterium avium]
MKPTAEQAAIVEAARSQKDLVIQAGAGTGKTSTLKMVARALGRRPAIYVAYNKAIATEAAAGFPEHVMCRTAHSLAFQAIGKKYAHRLKGPRELPSRRAEILGTTWLEFGTTVRIPPAQVARIAVDTVMRYCYSADDEVGVKHVPYQNGVTGADHDELARAVLPYAQRAWADACDPNGLLRFQHDYYLKMWALARPKLQTDVVMLDEAQDSNAVVAHLIRSQSHAQQLVVGDSSQQLYGWRGAIDALTDWPADELLYLSQSWRFGRAIADEANQWLSQLDTPLRLIGNPAIASEIRSLTSPKAVLCRTNAEAIERAMDLLATNQRVALVGGGADIRRLAEAAGDLKNGRRTSHPELYVFTSWAQLQEYVEDDQAGRDLKPFVDLIDTHGAETIIDAVNSLVDEKNATATLSTVHRAKGREWESVAVAADFPEPLGRDEIPRADAMIGYVAITRARKLLDRDGLAWIDRFTRRHGHTRGTDQRRTGGAAGYVASRR